MTAGDCMSSPCITVTPEMSVEDCCHVMEENQVRRVPGWTKAAPAAALWLRPTLLNTPLSWKRPGS